MIINPMLFVIWVLLIAIGCFAVGFIWGQMYERDNQAGSPASTKRGEL